MSSAPRWPTALGRGDLRARWRDLCRGFGAADDAAESAWREIDQAYSASDRHYHTLEHVGEMLAWIDHLAGPSTPGPALELATWLHDIVYDATRRDNEAASGRWSEQHLPRLGVEAVTVIAVTRLTLATADHDPVPADADVDKTDRDTAILVDADLAILGAPPDRYARYALDVRSEYGSLTDAQWSSGRRRVLEGFIARQRLYHHPTLAPLERQARRNLSSELARLTRPA